MNTKIEIPAVFPFCLSDYEGNQFWLDYYLPRRQEIAEHHGSWTFVGRNRRGADSSGQMLSWSWYEVDVAVIDERTVEFQTYGMKDAFYGGRGFAQEKFTHTFDTVESLKKFVELRKRNIAEYVYELRQEAERIRMRDLAIVTVYNELYETN